MDLLLLPEPKDISLCEGVYKISSGTTIAMPAQATSASYAAACQLRDEIQNVTGMELPIVKAFTPPAHAILLVCGNQEAAAFNMTTAPPENPCADQAYNLSVSAKGIILHAGTPQGLFYAVQTMRQMVRLTGPDMVNAGLPALTIRDWPALPYRGLMLDISRGKVPTLETLYKLVAELSHYKMNVLQLYTEHTYQFSRHPKIGQDCGSLSNQDIIKLDAFCRTHYIELMPNLQSFGHARHTLSIPEYQHLAESDKLWTLSPAIEETYTLLDELYADILPPFSSTTFNLNCDETYDLGTGVSKSLADKIGVGRVYLNHILRIRQLAARYGRRVQIWGDILLHHPELIGEVPEDVILLDWGYEAAESYPSTHIFGESGRTFWVCPGTSSWNTLFPRLHNANTNIRNFVRDGVSAGAQGMLITDWGDYGHYQPIGLSWYGYLFGAAQAWSGGITTEGEFDAAFGPLFFGQAHQQILESVHTLARTNTLPGIIPHANVSLTVLALFDEPLAGESVTSLPPETLSEMLALSQKALSLVDGLAQRHPREQTLREIAFTARLTAYAARKTSLAQRIRQDLHLPDLDSECLYLHGLALKALDRELVSLQAEFESLWLARARSSEIAITLSYYARLRVRYLAAIDWLGVQAQALSEGKPADADLKSYNRYGHRVLWQT